MSAPVPTLRIDTSGTAFGAAPTYTDRTSYLMTGSAYPVSITFGKQDEEGEVSPSRCSFYLKNDTGFWTPDSAAAPAAWDVGCPVNLRLTYNATTYDRFTGYVDLIEPTWPGGVQSWSVVKVSCTDVSARLGIAKPLRSLLQEEMLADSPLYFYPLGEPSGAASAGDVSGNNKPPAVVYNAKAGAWAVSFGEDMGMFEDTTGVTFGSWHASDPATSLSICRNGENVLPAASGHTQIVWFRSPTEAPATDSPLLLWSSDAAKSTRAYLSLNAPDGKLRYNVNDASNSALANSLATVCDGGLHMAAAVLESDRMTATLYLDGVAQSSLSLAGAPIDLSALRVNEIGAVTVPTSGGSFPGLVTHVAAYGSALSAARVLAIYQAGAGTGPTESSDARFSRIAGYAGLTTSGLPTGQATMGGQRTAGAGEIEALQKVARTEGTVSYVTGAGALTFQERDDRYHKAVGLTLAASDVAADFSLRRDRQGVANEFTVSRDAGASQLVVDAASQADIGRFDGGSLEVAPSTDDDAYSNAAWRVANRKTTRTRLPSLAVDLYRQTSTSLVANCLSATIGTKVQVTGLPSNAPASSMTLFVEGYTETIGYDDWRLEFFTSPVGLEDSVWVLQDATYGAIDSTNVLAF